MPRRVRSPRLLSQCNEQIFKFSQQNLQIQHLEPQQQQQQKQAKLTKRESQRSLIIDSTKAASYEAISASETKSASKSKKSAQVRKIFRVFFCTL